MNKAKEAINKMKKEYKKRITELLTEEYEFTEGTFETGIKAIQGKGYKYYYNSKYDVDELIKRLESRKYNCSDWPW